MRIFILSLIISLPHWITVVRKYFVPPPTTGTVWYIRSYGGTRYSSGQPTYLCDGKADAAPSGSTPNQHCAFNDIRYMWAQGVYNTGTAPAWGWVANPNDIVDVGSGTAWRVGASIGAYDGLSITGNAAGSGTPSPPNGLIIRGQNYASCASQSSASIIDGGQGVGGIFNITGDNSVTLECVSISDKAQCGTYAGAYGATCTGSDDYANVGIYTANTATNLHLYNVWLHGLASEGILGPLGNGFQAINVNTSGNSVAGWNLDNNDGLTGNGTAYVVNSSWLFNGCVEEYPIVDSTPYVYCTDQNSGGNGDAIGTATATSSPAWIWTFLNNTIAYNTQDGLDGLHVQGTGSTITAGYSLFYGNMGQQVKLGNAGILHDSLIVGNCNAMRYAIPGTPSGYNSQLSLFCRAGDTAVYMSVGDGTTTQYFFNTMLTASAVGLEIAVTGGSCSTSTCVMQYFNNSFVGFANDSANGYPGGGNGNIANPIYIDTGTTGFLQTNSRLDHNSTYNYSTDWTCPNTGLGETYALCTSPMLTDQTWHLYGYGTMTPGSGSNLIAAGILVSGYTTNYAGATRSNPPNIGAY